MAKLSGPKRLRIALAGAYLVSLIVIYLTVYLTTMDRLIEERGPSAAPVEGAFRAIWEQAALEAQWAGIGAVVLVVAMTAVAWVVVLVGRWVLRGYRQP